MSTTCPLKPTERDWDVIEAVARVAAELGVSSAEVALAWVRSRPAVTSTLIGARTIEQLRSNLASLEITLAPEQLAQQNEELNFTIQKLLARLYGQRSERHVADPNQQQLDFGADPAVQDGLADAASEAEVLASPVVASGNSSLARRSLLSRVLPPVMVTP